MKSDSGDICYCYRLLLSTCVCVCSCSADDGGSRSGAWFDVLHVWRRGSAQRCPPHPHTFHTPPRQRRWDTPEITGAWDAGHHICAGFHQSFFSFVVQDPCSTCCSNTMSVWLGKHQEQNLRKHFTASSLNTSDPSSSDPWLTPTTLNSDPWPLTPVALTWLLNCFLYLWHHWMSLNKSVLIVCQLCCASACAGPEMKAAGPAGFDRPSLSLAEPRLCSADFKRGSALGVSPWMSLTFEAHTVSMNVKHAWSSTSLTDGLNRNQFNRSYSY